MPPTAREIARERFTADLLAAARTRVAAEGAARLSLRAVARDLGVASSAVYRYVESRDALLTLLIVEAYDAVGEVCEAAEAEARDARVTPAQTFLAVARAFRRWALEHRSAFELVYGTPVPEYTAPEGTVPHALRIWRVLARTTVRAHADGSWRPTGPVPDRSIQAGLVTPRALELGAEVVAEVAPELEGAWDETAAARTFALFTALLGAVSAELFGHLHQAAADHDRIFDVVVAAAAAGAGLHLDLT